MKILWLMAGFTPALFLACCPCYVRADVFTGMPAQPDPFTIDFNQTGSATVSIFGGSTYSETGFLAADQSGFLSSPVLTYALPEFVGPGGVNIVDSMDNIQHNLFFYSGASFSYMEYTSAPNVTNFGYKGATESGGTFTFLAGNGDPSQSDFYVGSYGIPEPGSVIMLGLGLAGLVGYSWRRRKQANLV